MTSAIDPSKPTSGTAYTQDVRDNFLTAATEIGILQDNALADEANIAANTSAIATNTSNIADLENRVAALEAALKGGRK